MRIFLPKPVRQFIKKSNTAYRVFLLSLLVIFSSLLSAWGQRHPATATTTVSPPYSVYLTDYFDAGRSKLNTTIVFNDFNEPTWDVRLRFTIESSRLKVQTRPEFIPARPVSVTPGVPVQLSGAELSEYFDFNNLSFSGITAAALRQNARLPEGMYSFCFEVLDYRSGKLLSAKSCAMAWLILQDPPKIVSPLCDTYVEPALPQNILFQWQQSNAISPNAAMGPQYKLHLWEMTDPAANPLSAIANAKALKIFESDPVSGQNFLYNIAAPTLDAGKVYLYQVQAVDPDGKDLFKNQGFSEVCRFYYGYPTGGLIALNRPLDKSGFAKKDAVLFKWQAPDRRVPGQAFGYYLKIVKVKEGQDPEEAMATEEVWYEETTNPLQALYGYGFQLKKPLDPMTDYAWQVKAVSGEQEVAQSPVYSFRGPGIIEEFYAGMHVVEVSSTDNADLTNLSGTGKFRWSPKDTAVVVFKNLNIKALAGGRNLLREGELVHVFAQPDTISLTPGFEKNGKAAFHAQKLRLNKKALSLQGIVKWALPYPAVSPDIAYVVTDTSWVNFDKFKINGGASLTDKNKFELLDPYQFGLELDPRSDFLIKNNKFFLHMAGKVLLPDVVKGSSSERIALPFGSTNQLFYIDSIALKDAPKVLLVKNAGLLMEPQTFSIDFSYEQSPGKLAAQKGWKGVYIDEYKLHYSTAIDKSGQLSLKQEQVRELKLADHQSLINWVGSRGLDFFISEDLKNTPASFNEFHAKLYQLKLNISNNTISESQISGGMLIPFIDTVRYFPYTIPLSGYGFREGYLDNLEGTSFTFNKGRGDQEVKIHIRRAVFARKNRLDMSLDLEWPSMEIKLQAVNGFRVWGNNAIGFGKPNGALALNKQLNAKLSGFPITIDGIGAGSSSGQYSFGTTGKVVMADDISGSNGPPSANVYTIAANPYASKESSPVIVYESPKSITSGGGAGSSAAETEEAPSFNTAALAENRDEMIAGANTMVEQISTSGGEVKTYSSSQIALVPPAEMDPSVAQLFNLYNDFNQRQKAYFDSVMLALSDPVTAVINAQADALNKKISLKIVALTDSINVKVDQQVTFVVENLRDRSLTMVSSENTVVYDQINSAAARIQLTLSKQLQASVKKSVHENVTLPLTLHIKEELAKNAAVYIKNEMISVGVDVKSGEAHAEIKGKVGRKLEGLAKELLDNSIDFKKVGSGIVSLGNDLFRNIDTKLILDQLTGEVAVIVAKAAVEAAAGDALRDLSESIGVAIPMNFTGLGDKIRKGDLKGILSLDPVRISVKTKFVSFNGLVKHTADDPLFGTVWRGDIDFMVKVPQTFALDGVFINGRKEGSSYWFCQISPPDGKEPTGGMLSRKAKALDNPVKMGPVNMVAASGRVYHHMRDDGKAVLPDPAMKYGAYMNFIFFDSKKDGGNLRLDVAAGIEMQHNGDYLVEFNGDMQGANPKPQILVVDTAAAVTGLLRLKYNSAEKHFLGYGAAAIERPKRLCASGSILVDVKPAAWRLALGSRDERLIFVPGCIGWSPTGWLDINETTAELGLGLMYSMHAEAAFDVGAVALGIGVEASVAAGIMAVVQYRPSLALNEAGIWIDVYGRVYVVYKAPLIGEGSLTLVEIYCQGNLKVKFRPSPTTVSGNVKGYVKLLSIVECNFDAGFEATL